MLVRTPAQIWEQSGYDIHPPGYYFLLAGWGILAGSSEFSLRLLSALISVMAVAVIWALGNRLFDRWIGLAAAVLVAINPLQVYYGQEARMYMLLGLLAAASVWLTAEVLSIPGQMVAGQFNNRRAAGLIGGLILINTAGLYTHYSFPFVLLAESLVFLIWMARRPRKWHSLITWGGIQLFAVILYAPWLPTAYHQITTWPHLTAGLLDNAGIIRALVYGHTLLPDEAQNGLLPLVLLAAIGLMPTPVSDEHKQYLSFAERIGLLLGWLIVPLLILISMGSLRQPTIKFLVPLNLALMLLAGRGVVIAFRLGNPLPQIERKRNVLLYAMSAGMLALALLPVLNGLWHLYFDPVFYRDNYRGAAQKIMAEAGPTATVVLSAPNQKEVFTYYYPDGPNIIPLPDAHTESTLATLLAEQRRIYALYWGEGEQDPKGVIENTLAANAFVTGSEWFGSVRMDTYVLYGPPATRPQVIVNVRYGDSIILEGYALNHPSLGRGEALGVTLFWHTEQRLDQKYKVFVHLYGPDGALVTQHDSEPANFLSPTDSWKVKRTVIDNHGLAVPFDAPTGTYQLAIGMYGYDGVRLPITLGNGESGGDVFAVTAIEVK
jgi:4-amino-4-deoxy-L-arabinose transferase-like glycosyltransferase